MKEKGLRIRKTKEAWRADYKTTTTIQAMSDSEAFSLFFRPQLAILSYSRQLRQAYSTNLM